jgi:DNA helicase-2/ATP-dependent DNA helicase PcrA
VTSSWPAGALPSPITVDDVAALLDLQLTDEQRQAIGADLAPGVIVAGAGSGKTAVMAARVVYLVGARLVRPEQVLGLTFTNKAAAELAARVRTALGRLRDTPWAPDSDVGDEPTVATYNAYAGRLVADHGLRIGVEPSSRLITRAQQWQLASRAVRSHRGEISYLALQPRSVVAQVLELAGQLADHLADAADVHAEHERLRARLAELGEPLDKQLAEVLVCLGKRDELLEFVESYQRLKEERELIDFGDQVAHAARVARLRPEVGEIERAQHAVVLLDEYQDTGVAQRLMLQALYCGGHPVTAVGDPCQSIYGWRGASVGNLVHFPEHFPRADGRPAGVHYLSTNFRSGGRVLALANATSASLRDATAAVHVPELRPGTGEESSGSVVAALLTTADDEAEWLADHVEAALAGGTALQEIAVLARKRSQFEPVRRALEARDIPVEVVGLGGLLDTPEVNDLVAVLELLHDPTANVAVVRLLTGPRWRIGPRDLAALGSRARQLAGGRSGATTRSPTRCGTSTSPTSARCSTRSTTRAIPAAIAGGGAAVPRHRDRAAHRSASAPRSR